MGTQTTTFPIEFKGGLISNMSPLQQGANAIGSATILQNFEPDKEGGYTKIKGFSKFSSTEITGSGNVLGLKVVSSGRVIAARKNASNFTQYYYSTGGAYTSVATSANTNGGKVKHADFNFTGTDKIVFVDGTNYPGIYTVTGNTMTFLSASSANINTDAEGVENVAIFKNHAFYSKDNNILFTAPYTVDDFSAANGAGTLNVGNDVTGMIVFREQLIIFTTNTIKRLVGNTEADFRLEPITERIGCINGDTIQEYGGDVIYLAPDGVRLLSATDRIGDFGLDVASDTIYTDATAFIDSATVFSSVTVRGKSQYRIFAFTPALSKGASKGLMATKFAAQGASGISWASITGIKAFVADSQFKDGEETICFANEDGYVYRMESTNGFDGENIEAIYESPFMPITDPQSRKTLYRAVLYIEPTGEMDLSLNLEYDFDSQNSTGVIQPPTIPISTASGVGSTSFFGAASATFGASTVTFGGALPKIYPALTIGSCKTFSMRITDLSTRPSFTLDTAIFEYRQNDRQ
tara:strand:- start:1268 stop:2836 length:1569 start_codon:yes stop_codon:yes gene_type:complete